MTAPRRFDMANGLSRLPRRPRAGGSVECFWMAVKASAARERHPSGSAGGPLPILDRCDFDLD